MLAAGSAMFHEMGPSIQSLEILLWLVRCGCACACSCGDGVDGERFGDRFSSTTLKAVSHDAG
jgi:hypothetical protein